MILSESEKNRIRALHREASVIKQPLNEWTATNGGKKKTKEGELAAKVIKDLGTKIYDKLPEDTKQAIEKAKKGEGESSKLKKAKDAIVDYLDGNQGLLPGDQTEIKKNLVKAGEDILNFFMMSDKDREYMRKFNAPQKIDGNK